MQSPLDLPTVQALGEYSSHPSVQASANAWLAAYSLAHQLAFTEAVAMRQADTAWDRAAELWHQPLGSETVPFLVGSALLYSPAAGIDTRAHRSPVETPVPHC